ncbi:MAG: CAP domain-containing protein [Chloroflexota bacterium]
MLGFLCGATVITGCAHAADALPRFGPAAGARNSLVIAGAQGEALELVEPLHHTEAAMWPDMAAPLELALFERANVDRVANGLAPLTLDAALLPVARTRAADQTPGARLSHMDSSGHLAFVGLLAEAGAEYQLAGENLARLTGPEATAAARAANALMNSPTHRANILEPTFDRLAVGMTVDANGQIVFAQIFRANGTPAG